MPVRGKAPRKEVNISPSSSEMVAVKGKTGKGRRKTTGKSAEHMVKHESCRRSRKCLYTGKLEHDKRHLKTLMKQLSLLRLLKGAARFHRLYQMVTKCRKALILGPPPNIIELSSSESDFKMNEMTTPVHERVESSNTAITSVHEWLKSSNNASTSLQEDLETWTNSTALTEDRSGTLSLRPPRVKDSLGTLNDETVTIIEKLRTSNESTNVQNMLGPSPESICSVTPASSYEILLSQWFNSLPQRLILPSPRVLCRPSPLRWVKPCCTRSCEHCLENNNIFQYHL
ncbi:TP53-target gene 5 protein [Ambystoma mexicanum]|uniref:TP53-target gene 5 protein n=1 Tax=Ambystoma mexicanum TaxID=8296 RepID=UPI0037E94F95